jgi:hypothetical protein
MSAYVVDQVHIDILVETALLGPTDIGPVRPDNVWSRLSWTARPLRSFATFAELDANRRTITSETADETGLGAHLDVPAGNSEPLDPFEAAIAFAMRRAAAKRRRRMTLVGSSEGGRA